MSLTRSFRHLRSPGPSRSDQTVKPGSPGLQGLGVADGHLWDWTQARRGLRLRTLIVLRWVSLFAQLTTVLWVALGLHFTLPLGPCLMVLALTGWMNLSLELASPAGRLTGRWESVFQLSLDLIEMTVLIGLTGGLANPFILLLVAPVTVAAATLPARSAAALGLLSAVCVTALFFFALPLPWFPGEVFPSLWLYRFGMWAATVSGIGFNAAYAWQVSAEAARMELALATTQAVLAREQRLSALGGLAAAAAHELGTPLATLQVVTRELLRDNPEPSPLREDLQLLSEQSQRCRDILMRLSRSPDAEDAHHARLAVIHLLEEVAEPYRVEGITLRCQVEGGPPLEVRRLPEVLHGLSSLVENAVDFAGTEVELRAQVTADALRIEIRDDGPGFAADVLTRLGEPYLTTRSQGENSRTHHQGLGLGFFIAKTLLERSGARVEVGNRRPNGAVVTALWSRASLEAVTG